MIDKPLIEKKLRKIEEFLRELNTVNIESFDEFVGNIVTKRFIERNIELAIESMTDTDCAIKSAERQFRSCQTLLKDLKGAAVPSFINS